MYTKDSNNTYKNKFDSNLQDTTDEGIINKATDLKDKAKDTVSAIKDKALDVTNQLKSKVSDMKDTAADAFIDSYETVKDRAIIAEEDVIEYIRDNPVKSVLLAALAGYLLSFIKRK